MTLPDEDVGTWLLDTRLWSKYLDVRIEGTVGGEYRGKHEGELGFVCVQKSLSSVMDTTLVRVGHTESRKYIQINHLHPMRTMEMPLPASLVQPGRTYPHVHRQPNVRVVIIGPDTNGDETWIGHYGLTLHSPHPDLAVVSVFPSWPPPPPHVSKPQCLFLAPTSICRSTERKL